MKIIWNPSPFEETVLAFPLHKINVFVLNEIEGKLLTGVKSVDEVIPALHEKYPDANILLTLGGEGSTYFCGGTIHTQGIFPVVAVDTTAAGDTFLGYFVYGLVNRFPVAKMLEMAAKAASITVTRKGAAASIPALREVVQK